MHYHAAPPLRLSSVNILTDLGWWAGTFHVPGRVALVNLGRVTGVAEWVNQQV
ncbi:MAG TPA: hypothetical protein VM094_07555 [Gemmatimonadales bacterium]|nr:hypothetical protein [Gemmatimonadales bacterium]